MAEKSLGSPAAFADACSAATGSLSDKGDSMQTHQWVGVTWLLLVSLCGLQGVAHAEKPIAPESLHGVVKVDAEQAIELILNRPELLVIDSRRQDEYDKGHIEGAINVLDTELAEDILEMHAGDRKRPLLFYCNGARCLRSSNASRKARDWGYSEIYWFRGGWQEWRQKNYPIYRRP
jgi:rhodanese-related sulfurtransferase